MAQMPKKSKLELMSFLDASKSDLMDRIIWLRTNQGKEPIEADIKGLDKEALIRLLIVLEENGHGCHRTWSLDTDSEPSQNVNLLWRNEKLLEFCNRKQRVMEHEGKYLEAIKNMAIEAGFKEGSKLFERNVTNRFIDGIHDTELKSRILNMKRNPSIEDLQNTCNTSGFDLLLRRNVQHIWEKIFLSLDYESFKKCLTVCQAWNGIFTKESFISKAKSTFAAKMWMDTEHLESQVWKSSKDISAWTTNGEEVVFIESNNDIDMIHFINSEGKFTSRKLRLRRAYVRRIWILNHIILIKTGERVYSVDKLTLKQAKLFFFSWWYYDLENLQDIIFVPNVGVRFLKVNLYDGTFSLKEVSFDHSKVYEWKKSVCTSRYYISKYMKSETDKQGCCSSVESAAPELENDSDDVEYLGIFFSEDGSHFIYYSDSEIQVFSVDKQDAGLSITHLWDDKDDVNSHPEANSHFVMYVTYNNGKPVLRFRDIKDGRTKKQIDLPHENLEVHSIILSKFKMYLFLSYLEKKDRINNELMIVDLENYQIQYAHRRNEEFKDLWANLEDVHAKDTEHGYSAISNGRVVMYPTRDEGKFFFMDLTSANPNKILDERKLITPRNGLRVQDKTWGVGKFKRFVEVKKGLCIFDVQSESSSFANKKEVKFIMEKIAWKGEKMPKAMDTWVKWLEKVD